MGSYCDPALTFEPVFLCFWSPWLLLSLKIGWVIEMVSGGMVALILELLNEGVKRHSYKKVGLPKYLGEVIYFVVMWQLVVKLISYVIC